VHLFLHEGVLAVTLHLPGPLAGSNPRPGRAGPLPPPLPTKGHGVRYVDYIETGYEPGLVSELAALHGRVYAPLFDVGHRFEAERAAAFSDFLASFAPQRDGLWTARVDGRIVGSAALAAHGSGLPTLRWVAVDALARGRGAGRHLVRLALDHARASGADGVRLESHERLREALALYSSFGFAHAATETTYLAGSPFTMLVLELRFGDRSPPRAP
jgi:ribosomal protein S18 acetylase RimI-like enzyme